MSNGQYARQYADRSAAGLSTAQQFDPGRRDEPGVAGDWSLKDLLGHLSYWDSITCARLEADAAGRVYAADPRSDDPINAEQALKRADLSWDDVLAEVTSTRDRLVDLLRRPTNLDVSEVGSHWVEHRQDMEAWLKRNQPIADGNLPNG